MNSELVVPELGESISEAVLATWLKSVGDTIAVDEAVLELETDKVSVQIPAPAAGVLTEQRYGEGDTVKVGEVLGVIESTPHDPAEPGQEPVRRPTTRTSAPAGASPTPATNGGHASRLSPAERRALREGSAPAPAQPTAHDAHSSTARPLPTPVSSPPPRAPDDRERIVPMTPLRKTIARRLVQAQHEAAILTTFNEVDMSRVLELRKTHQDEFVEKHGVKLGFMSFFLKAAIASLKELPSLNAEVRGDAIAYKHHYDIGIAVGSGKGLVVPVVRDADLLSFADIEKQIAEYARKAQAGQLTLDELAGGTFTISNGGVYGSMMSTPLLNAPQTGILGMHNISDRPVVIDGQVVVRPIMYVALSYDHRVADGREAVGFLVGLKQRVEHPDRLLFSL